MALTRKFLAGKGLEADVIDEIISAHTETVNALKDERDSYKADAEKLPGIQSELDALKASSEKDPWKVKYDALKEDFDNYKTEQNAKATKAAKTDAYRAILKEAGIADKRIDAVLRVSDVDGLKLDKDGKIEEKAALLKSIKDEWAEFIVQESVQGARTATPPTGTNGGSAMTREEIMKIKDTAERQKAIAENMNLFQRSV